MNTLDAGAVFFSHIKELSLPEHLETTARQEFLQIKSALLYISKENRENIYNEAGEYGVYLRQFIEDN